MQLLNSQYLDYLFQCNPQIKLLIKGKMRLVQIYLKPLCLPYAGSLSSSFKKLNYSPPTPTLAFFFIWFGRVFRFYCLGWSIFGNKVSKNFALHSPCLHGFSRGRNTGSLSLDRSCRIYINCKKQKLEYLNSFRAKIPVVAKIIDAVSMRPQRVCFPFSILRASKSAMSFFTPSCLRERTKVSQ